MNILLIGYGKMGQTIEKIALERSHAQPRIADAGELQKVDLSGIDVAIEFTQPEAAYENIRHCIENGVPVVSGTTGWLDRKPEIEALIKEKNGAFFYASNFSVGVNLFFKLNKLLARMMDPFDSYTPDMEETHHIHKKDAPSGTAITLAEGLLENYRRKKQWVLDTAASGNDQALAIKAIREDEVPGTHTIRYHSDVDTIEIKHTAHNRTGFATGAVLAAEWIVDKKGVFGMNDMLNL